MDRSKKILGGVIISFFIGAVLVYYVANREKPKTEDDSLKNIKPNIDSLSRSNEVIPGGMGAKPEANPKDGSVKIVEEFIKSNAKNPDTFEFLEWSEVSSEDGYWKVRCKYTGVSSFNAEVTTNSWFYIRNNKVVYTKIISKI